MVLGGGLEPPRLTAYAPQTYVSAISPPELVQGREMINTTYDGRKDDYLARGRDELLLVLAQRRDAFSKAMHGRAGARPYLHA